MNDSLILSNNRSCYACQRHHLCFVRRDVDQALRLAGFINNREGKAPANYTDVFTAVANACTEYKPFPQEPE